MFAKELTKDEKRKLMALRWCVYVSVRLQSVERCKQEQMISVKPSFSQATPIDQMGL